MERADQQNKGTSHSNASSILLREVWDTLLGLAHEAICQTLFRRPRPSPTPGTFPVPTCCSHESELKDFVIAAATCSDPSSLQVPMCSVFFPYLCFFNVGRGMREKSQGPCRVEVIWNSGKWIRISGEASLSRETDERHFYISQGRGASPGGPAR